jgi:hypothetical protein
MPATDKDMLTAARAVVAAVTLFDVGDLVASCHAEQLQSAPVTKPHLQCAPSETAHAPSSLARRTVTGFKAAALKNKA